MEARSPKLNSPKSKTVVCIYTYLFVLSVFKVFIFNVFGMLKERAVVRALATHQCGPGSIPRLVLYSALRGFSPATPVFPSPQQTAFDLI